MPHGSCYLWQTPLVWLHVISDFLIAVAYFSIPAMLIYFVYKRPDMKFMGIFYLFGAFIVLCGTGHLLEIWTLWHPAYWLSGFEQAMTALVSCYTALKMVELLPQFLSLKNPEQLDQLNQELHKEIVERKRTETALKNIAAGTATATGKDFFAALVTHLAKALDVPYVLVSEAVGQPHQKLKPLAVWAVDRLSNNTEYAIEETPCGMATTTLDGYYCGEKLQQEFPEDIELQTMKVESYIGEPLLDRSNRVIGNLCILDTKPIIKDDRTEAILKIFAARAAGELERKWAEDARKTAYDELELRVEERTNDLVSVNLALEAEIKFRKTVELTLRSSENRLRKQQLGLLSLAKNQNIYQGSLSQALQEINEITTRILNVERVSVWFYNDDQSEIICANLYQRTLKEHSQGQKLSVADYPNYFQALENETSLAVYDAKTDSRTAEFKEGYLTPLLINSMLDVPIHLKGRMVGVICIEHTGEKRPWEIEEQNFVNYLAYMISLAIESRDRALAEESLREIADRERAIAKIIQKMRQTLDFQTIFSVTTKELRTLLKCDRVAIYRFNPDWSGDFVCESVSNDWSPLVQENQDNSNLTDSLMTHKDCTLKRLGNPKKTIQDTYLQKTQGGAYKTGSRYLLVEDTHNAGLESCYVELLEQFQARAYITVPIFCGDKLWGLLANYQNSGPRNWSKADIKVVVDIGTQLGVALQQTELFNQIKQQSAALEKAAIKADAANRAKSEFLASMSHELRTPLNAILGFTQVLNGDSHLTTEQQQHIQIIHRAGEHLLALINDILEMSKIEAGQITFNENSFDLYKLLDSLEEMFRLKASAKKLELIFQRTTEVPQYVKTDESKFRQVLINLLSNAIKFTDTGGVQVRVKAFEAASFKLNDERSTSNQRLRLSVEVEDTGFGIAPEELDRLFEPFAQTETGRQSQQGTGLGLPISQKFVHMMGGTLRVNSAIARGSTFAFDIQIHQTDRSEVQSKTKSLKAIGLAPDQPQYRILVVEDRLENRLLLMKMLSKWGFQKVREAINGEEALEIFHRWQPDLIWMDMQMPVMDGYEATKKIKADPLGQNTTIISLTASAFEEDRKEILAVGCDDFVRKPFQAEELLAKMEQYLGVTFLYEDSKASTESKSVSEVTKSEPERNSEYYLSQMSGEWRSQVYLAAEECSDEMIFELVAQIPPENAPLGQTLTDLAQNFLFDEIMELTKIKIKPIDKSGEL